MNVFLVFMLGASLGSFLGLVVMRFPEQSIIFPSSHCDCCQKKLAPRDLIPIFSQLINQFRCRFCQQGFPIWYWVLETACGALLLLTFFQIISLAELLTIYLGIMLAIYDWQSQSYPFMIWFIFFLPGIFIGKWSILTLPLLILAGLAQLNYIKIGSGDFLYLASISLVLESTLLLWSLQIACLMALGYCLFRKKTVAIPFVPFILVGYLALLFFTTFII